jgi:hypothetical protein
MMTPGLLPMVVMMVLLLLMMMICTHCYLYTCSFK